MGLHRRTFLAHTGFSLLAMALGDRFARQIQPHGQLLAQTTPRKLALLVGIDDYPALPGLKGCGQDVALQRELLIHRFGFLPADIVTLTNQEATRGAIATAFQSHLSQQAKPGDVVVFHFSGYGAPVIPPADGAPIAKGFLTYQGPPQKNASGAAPTQDLLEATLMGLGRSLATDQVSFVFDTGFQGHPSAIQSNGRGRSCPVAGDRFVSQEEWEFHKSLFAKGNGKKGKKGPPGLILQAAQDGGEAVEISYGGRSVGLFTLALTQALWRATPAQTLYFTWQQVNGPLQNLRGSDQKPNLQPPAKPTLFPYGPDLQPDRSLPGTLGIIDRIYEKNNVAQADVTLLGLPRAIAHRLGPNSLWCTVPDGSALSFRQLQGHQARTQLVVSPKESRLGVGMGVQEQQRCFSKDLRLTVALGDNLSRIERVDATSALVNMPTVKRVISVREDDADCVFSKIKSDRPGKGEEEGGHYGLYTVGGRLFGQSLGRENEAVESAVKRLGPYFQKFLSWQIWQLTSNEYSSQLATRVGLEEINPGTPNQGSQTVSLLSQGTPSFQGPAQTIQSTQGNLVSLRGDRPSQYRLENQGAQPLYPLIVQYDEEGEIFLLNPEAMVVPAGESVVIPHPGNGGGLVFTQILLAIAPFSRCQTVLSSAPNGLPAQGPWQKLTNPLPLSRAILADLTAAGHPDIVGGPSPEGYSLHVGAWSGFSLIHRQPSPGKTG